VCSLVAEVGVPSAYDPAVRATSLSPASFAILEALTRAAARARSSQAELRTLAFSAIALGLLGLAGLASPVSAWHGTQGASEAPTAVLRALALIGGIVLAVALLLIWAEPTRAPRRRRKRRPVSAGDLDEVGASFWTAGKTTAVVLLALALFCLAALPFLSRPSGPPGSAGSTLPQKTQGSNPAEVRGADHSLDLGWLVLPMALTLVILAPAAFVIRRRRRHRDRAEDPLQRAVRASLAELESERDPRRAILRAYGHMEHAFSDVEIVRAQDETASEFLVRSMRRLRVSADAATALTDRFEEARFSTHTLTEGDRELALISLRRVEQDLADRP
jgi:uncharacterized protein DUF4129